MSLKDTAAAVLVAEDEAVNRTVLAQMLGDAGYKVIEAENGHEAMAKIEELAASLAGMVTDIRMGDGPDGWQVARHARELNPSLPVVYTSGDSAAD